MEISIEKSLSDYKTYKMIELRNKLRVLLISDIDSDNILDDSDISNKSLTTEQLENDSFLSSKSIETPCKINSIKHNELENHKNDLNNIGSNKYENSTVNSPNTSVTRNDNENFYVKSPNSSIISNDSILNQSIQKHVKSAAALCITVGSFEDPPELQGLSHYLEHMLFMGSEKYPTENDFDSAVSQYGGSSNAWTDAEKTLYHFDCHKEHFVECLDKFANFFIEPLMHKDSMDREVVAVNSEFEMSFSDDANRFHDLLQSTSKADSPYRIMNAGNIKTLKLDPVLQNIDVYERLQQYRKEKYSSHKMALAIQSRETLDVMEHYVTKIFQEIPLNENSQAFHIDSKKFEKPFDTPEFNKFFEAIPLSNVNILKMTWDMPSVVDMYQSQPFNIINYILSNEAPGSLSYYLRDKNYIVEIQVTASGGGYERTSFNSLFQITLALTDQGLGNITEVIEILFAYIHLLQNTQQIPQYIIDEFNSIMEMKFRYLEQGNPVENVENLSQNIHLYPLQDIICGPYLLKKFSNEFVKSLIDLMTVDKVNILLASKQFENKTNAETKWYKVKYNVRDFTEEERQKWSNPINIEDLSLPRPNQYIAKDFTVIPLPENRSQQAHYPVNLSANEFPEAAKYGHLWHCYDYKFRVPKAYIHMNFSGPSLKTSAKDGAILDVIMYALDQRLNSTVQESIKAGLSYNIKVEFSSIVMELSGFSDKLPVLFRSIIDELVQLVLCNDKLEVYRIFLSQYYTNSILEPTRLVRNMYEKLLISNEYSNWEKYHALQKITLDDITQYSGNMFLNLTVNSYFHGNITEQQSVECFDYAVKQLGLRSHPYILPEHMRYLIKHETRIRVQSFNHNDHIICIWCIYHLGPGDLHLVALNQFFNLVISEQCFDYLRTKETLGYHVGFDEAVECGIVSSLVFVESGSDKFPLQHCYERIQLFINTTAGKYIDGLSEKAFEAYKQSFIAECHSEEHSMSEAQARHWAEIFRKDYIFDRRSKLADIIQNLTKQQLLEFYRKYYLNDSANCRKLILEVDSYQNDQDVKSSEPQLKYIPIDNNTNSDRIEQLIKFSPMHSNIFNLKN